MKNGCGVKVSDLLPGNVTMLGGLVSAITLARIENTFDGCWADLIKWASVAGGYGLVT